MIGNDESLKAINSTQIKEVEKDPFENAKEGVNEAPSLMVQNKIKFHFHKVQEEK